MILAETQTAAQVLEMLLERWFVTLGAIVVLAWALTEATKYIANSWRRAREAQLEAAQLENEAKLKALMLQQGLPPDEIERVLNAGSGSLRKRGDRLEELMIEQGMEPEQIQRVLRAKAGQLSDTEAEALIVEKLVENEYEAGHIEKVLAGARANGVIDHETARLVQVMAENWMDADDMARVLRARRADRARAIDIREVLKAAGVKDPQAEKIMRVVQAGENAGPEAPTRSA